MRGDSDASLADWSGTLVAVMLVAARRGSCSGVPQAALDPTAEFFDDSVVHELRLWINSRDWETLKTNFLSNAYYPADLEVEDRRRSANVGIRSRGNGSRSGFKPGLRVDIDRYSTSQKFLGMKSFVLRNNTQDPSQHARVAQHAVLPPHGADRARARRSRVSSSTTSTPACTRSSSRWTSRSSRESLVRTAGTCTTTTTRRTRRRTTSRTGAAIRRLCAAAVQARDAREQLAAGSDCRTW